MASLFSQLSDRNLKDIISLSEGQPVDKPFGKGGFQGTDDFANEPSLGIGIIGITIKGGKEIKRRINLKDLRFFKNIFGKNRVKVINTKGGQKIDDVKIPTLSRKSALTQLKREATKRGKVADNAPKGKGGKAQKAIDKAKAKKAEGQSRRVKVSDVKKKRRDRMSPDAKAAGSIGAAGLSAAIIAAGDQSQKRKKSKIPRPPSSTGVQDKAPIGKDKTPSSDAGTKGLPTGAKQKAVDKMDVASKRRKLQRRPASNRMAPPTGKGGDQPLNKAKSGTQTFGSFKEAFKYYNNLPSGKKPATFTYKGKSYANVTKDEVKKAGFKTLRAFLNAKKKKKK